MFGLRYELILFRNTTKPNNATIARITATFTPIRGVKIIHSLPVLTVFNTKSEYKTTRINNANVS
jgi:hypothetical protein